MADRSNSKKPKGSSRQENALLLREGAKIVQALGRMLAPSCEVVLHDLSKPDAAILAIENPLSDRRIGEPTTEMGIARILDRDFPDVVQNYRNSLPDGRPVKSTSIGLRNSAGKCVAAICLNLDISLFDTMHRVLGQLARTDGGDAPVRESLRSITLGDLREEVIGFAAERSVSPRGLSVSQRRELVLQLQETGLLQLRGAIGIVGETLGVSRASIYNDLTPAESS